MGQCRPSTLAGYPEECKAKPGSDLRGEEGASCVNSGQCCEGLVCADRGERNFYLSRYIPCLVGPIGQGRGSLH